MSSGASQRGGLNAAVLHVCATLEALALAESKEEGDRLLARQTEALHVLAVALQRWTPGSRGVSAEAAERLLDIACREQSPSSLRQLAAAGGAHAALEALLRGGHMAMAPLLFSEGCIERLVAAFSASASADAVRPNAGCSRRERREQCCKLQVYLASHHRCCRTHHGGF